jgi:hypothetical protein
MKKTILMLIFILTGLIAKSQDRVFARTYQSNVLGKNNKDLEIWNTYSFGRDYFYTKLQQRFEFEIGLSNKLQTSVYINREQVSRGIIAATSNSNSFSSEWKYKLSDPVANKVGFALYGELTASTDEIEIEGKLIFDKKINRSLLAFNIVCENEMEFESEQNEFGPDEVELESEEVKLEFDLGYMYSLNKGFGIGMELKNDNIFEEGKWMNSPLFLGPTLSYGGDRWWIIFNALPQMVNLKKEKGITESLELNDHEKFDFRLLFAYNF